MADLPGSGAKNHGAAGGGEPKRKRAKFARAGGDGNGKGSSPPAAALASARPESAGTSLADVTVEDADVLDCGVCFHPLKPPIFQCDMGHVICSPCRDKLKGTGKCHVCGVATRNYHRCHDMERLVDSIHVPCPHAAHGCAMKLAYHNQETHRLACVHAPCHCPGEACTFVGSTEALLDHFSAVHGWPCFTHVNVGRYAEYRLQLHDGFNFFLTDCPEKLGATASIRCLLLLIVARQQHARTIFVHCIDPHADAASGDQGPNSKELKCNLSYSLYALNNSHSGINQRIDHCQLSRFRVACTNLSNGLPKPEDCFQVVVPNSIIGDHDKTVIKVGIRIFY